MCFFGCELFLTFPKACNHAASHSRAVIKCQQAGSPSSGTPPACPLTLIKGAHRQSSAFPASRRKIHYCLIFSPSRLSQFTCRPLTQLPDAGVPPDSCLSTAPPSHLLPHAGPLQVLGPSTHTRSVHGYPAPRPPPPQSLPRTSDPRFHLCLPLPHPSPHLQALCHLHLVFSKLASHSHPHP